MNALAQVPFVDLSCQWREIRDAALPDIDAERAMDDIAATLTALIDEHGPRSVALYLGTNGLPYPASALMANAFIRAIESPMFFTANTIDQPGKQIALAAHGHWLGGDVDFHEADSWMLVGTNPLVSKAIGIPGQNPAQNLKAALGRGMKLIVIDPRKSQTAARAAIHLQPRPGEDATILAGMINFVIGEGLCDTEFLTEHVEGFDRLAEAVAEFSPEYVAERADIPVGLFVAAARLFATHGERPGMVNAGTGANFAMHGNLLEYLCLCLTTICGRWQRAGERVTRPNTLMPAFVARAQAHPPYEGWGYGERLRVRGLTDAVCGMPTAALADEILMPGEGQVKALICIGGNPMAAWPDQRKTHRALESLELLVTLDTEMSLTSRLADYVIAPKMQMETPAMTQGSELIKYYTSGTGIPAAYAAGRWKYKGSNDLMFQMLSFRFAPELMVIVPLFVIYNQIGLFDTKVGMIWVLQLVTMPLVVWILRSYFEDLPEDLEQAALLDGYTRSRAFVMVALPIVRPGIAAAALLAFIFAWNNYVFPLILADSNAGTVTVAITKFLGGGGQAYYNLTAAAAIIAALPPLILALTIQRYLVRGLSFGAVKA